MEAEAKRKGGGNNNKDDIDSDDSEDDDYDDYDNYEPDIKETVAEGDVIRFYHHINIPAWKRRMVEAKVIYVKSGRDGTGYGGLLQCETIEEDTQEEVWLPQTQTIKRLKYVNKQGSLVDVPDGEGREGWIHDFDKLQGSEEGTLKKHLSRKSDQLRDRLDAKADETLKKIQDEGGMVLDDALRIGKGSKSKVKTCPSL